MIGVNVPVVWPYRRACEAVDVRDMDRSTMSGVPKKSGPNGMYSHHHRQLRSRGGNDSPANLVLLTGSGTTGEHGWVHKHVGQATVLGYIVRSYGEPARVPIWRLDMFGMEYGWHMQTNDGDLIPSDPPSYPEPVVTAALAAFEELRIASRRAAIKDL